MFKREAKQFCLNTDLHGYRFIILPRRVLLERFFWSGVCVIALLTAISLLCIAYIGFQESPTVTVTDTNHYPIWHYLFPAVTICNYNSISRNKSIQLAQELEEKYNIKETNLFEKFKLLFYLYEYHIQQNIPLEKLEKLQNILDKGNYSIKEVLKKLSTSCNDMLVKCLWKGEQKRCDSIFETIITTSGYCCSFNYYALKNHTFSGMMAHKITKEPRRVSACGYQTGLEILVDNNPEDNFVSLIPSLGHKVLLHYPYKFPDWNTQNNLIHTSSVNFLGLNPTITYCSEETEQILPEKRKCWFPHEKTLLYFKGYSFHNCMVDCRMKLTIQLCNCVPAFFVPDDTKFHPARFCNLLDIGCLSTTADIVRSSVPGYNFSNLDPNHIHGTETGVCDCLPDCEFTNYNVQNSYGVLAREFSMNHPQLYGGVTLKNHSVIRVFFNDLVGTKNRTDLRYNWHTLLAFYGGLLGFFMGFSFISGIEVLYFFTIRPITTKNKSHSKKILKIYDKRSRSKQHFY